MIPDKTVRTAWLPILQPGAHISLHICVASSIFVLLLDYVLSHKKGCVRLEDHPRPKTRAEAFDAALLNTIDRDKRDGGQPVDLARFRRHVS